MNAAQGTTLPAPTLAYGESISRRVGQVTIRITNNSKVEGNYLLVVEHGPRRLDNWVEQLPTLDAARELANEWRKEFIGGAHPDTVTRPDRLRVIRARRRMLAPAALRALIAGEQHPTGEIRTQREHVPATLESLAGRGLAVKVSQGVYQITWDGIEDCRAEMRRLAEQDPARHTKMAAYAQAFRTLYGAPVMAIADEPARELVFA